MTVVDTPVWSEFFRRTSPRPEVQDELESLLAADEAVLLGPVRQELLTGLRRPQQFALLKVLLRLIREVPVRMSDYEAAAEMSNSCREQGVQGSPTDFLICAVSVRLGAPIFTLDRDFETFAGVLPIRLHRPDVL